jgi:hypothetical protein
MSRSNPQQFATVIGELANALQAAAILTAFLRSQSQSADSTTEALEAAVHRAVAAVRRLQPTQRGGR